MAPATNPFAGSGTTVSMLAGSMVNEIGSLVDELRRTRERRGMSVEDVARDLGLTPREVEGIESRFVSPTLDLVMAYALSVSQHVEFNVEDGESWARRRREHTAPVMGAVDGWVAQVDALRPPRDSRSWVGRKHVSA